jgi:hypothetical protein
MRPSTLSWSHRYLIGVDGLPLRFGKSCHVENALHDVVLAGPVLVDVRGRRCDSLPCFPVLVPELVISSQCLANSEVVAQGEGSSNDHVGVGADESLWLPERPSLWDAEFTAGLEAEASSTPEAEATC